jgi:hypothetical protein
MEQLLTLAEIEARFPGEWVLLDDIEADESLQIQRGKVVAHSDNRDEVYRRAVALRPKRFAIHYTGTLPADAAVVL